MQRRSVLATRGQSWLPCGALSSSTWQAAVWPLLVAVCSGQVTHIVQQLWLSGVQRPAAAGRWLCKPASAAQCSACLPTSSVDRSCLRRCCSQQHLTGGCVAVPCCNAAAAGPSVLTAVAVCGSAVQQQLAGGCVAVVCCQVQRQPASCCQQLQAVRCSVQQQLAGGRVAVAVLPVQRQPAMLSGSRWLCAVLCPAAAGRWLCGRCVLPSAAAASRCCRQLWLSEVPCPAAAGRWLCGRLCCPVQWQPAIAVCSCGCVWCPVQQQLAGGCVAVLCCQ